MKQFFIKPNPTAEARGPFSRDQITGFAQNGKLQPHHLISIDQEDWTSAENVKGLVFPDILENDYGLEPLEPPPPATPERVSKTPTVFSGNVPLVERKKPKANGPTFLRIPNRPLGFALGALGGLTTLALSCVAATLISAIVGSDHPLFVLIELLAGVFAGVAVFSAFALGTDTRIWLTPTNPHQVECTVHTRIGFLPTVNVSTLVTPQDQLVMFVRSAADTPQLVDMVFIAAMVSLFLFGVCPGIIFLIVWHNQKKDEGAASRLKLFLYSQARNNKPICLYHRQVGDYYGTNYGTPKEVEQVIELFQAQVELLYTVDD